MPFLRIVAVGISTRVAADPNNLPFSNEREEGFESRIAEVIARDLGARLEQQIEAVLGRRQDEIERILADHDVPLLPLPPRIREQERVARR